MARTSFLLIFLLISCASFAQEKSKKQQKAELKAQIAAKVDSMVNSKQLFFVARTAIPMGGEPINVNSNYTLDIKDDNLVVYLPYFGRAYQVDPTNSEGGIKFTSKIEKYSVSFKKGNYTITFEAKSSGDYYRFSFNVSQTGYCSLTVNSNNRQGISFEGELDKIVQ